MTEPHADRRAAIRDFLSAQLAVEVRAFYAQMTTVASAFLGGSVFFRDKLPNVPSCNWLLGVAWTGFAVSLALIVVVRLNNVFGAELAIDVVDQIRDPKCGPVMRQATVGRGLTYGALIALAIGIVALIVFAWLTLSS